MSDATHTRIVRETEAFRAAHSGTPAEAYARDALERLQTPRRPGTGGPGAAPVLTGASVARLIDHTQLKPEATDEQIRRLCAEAQTYEFASVCVHPCYVPLAATALGDGPVDVCTVVGFPHGANQPSTKAYEATRAVRDGATEIDMVLAVGRLKSGHLDHVAADVQAVVDAVREAATEAPPVVKVILETALLSDAEKAVACVAACRAGADYVKTSTGFASGGATTHDVALMRQIVGEEVGVKASGGIRSVEDVRQMVAHGASRIGASGGVAIMEGLAAETDY